MKHARGWRDRQRLITMISVLLILGMALILRSRHLDTTGIGGDQSFTLNTAMRWVNGGAIPLASNKSSVGFVNPPMIEYLYAVALRLWPDVLSVAMLTMVSGMVAIIAAGWAAWRVFGRRAALWTMFIYAVNPWSVYYSQLIWNQTMLPVFTSLTLAFLLVYFASDRRPIYLLLSFVTAACMSQVHPGATIQLVTMALIMGLYWRRLRLWPLLAGLVLFALSYIPYLIYQIGVGWGDIKEAWELARGPATTSIASILISLDLFQAKGLMGGVRFTAVFDILAAVLLAFSLAYCIWMGIRALTRRRSIATEDRKTTGLVIVLLWFGLPILFYLRSPYYLQIYYLLSQMPAHFLLIGLALSGIQRDLESLLIDWSPNRRRAGQFARRWLLPIPLVLLALWQLFFNIQFQNERVQESNVQIRHVRTTIQAADELLEQNPLCRLVALAEGHQLETSRLSLLLEFVSNERVVLADGRLALPFPEPCAVYLDALPGSRASLWLVANATALPDRAIYLRDEVWPVYVMAARDWELMPGDLHEPAQRANWDNGVSLVQYERGRIRPGETLPLRLIWQVQSPPENVTYHIGTYLLTMDNQIVAQADGPGFDSVQWVVGDNFLTWFDIPLPAELALDSYQLAVALYTWPELERVNLTIGDNTLYLEQLNVPDP